MKLTFGVPVGIYEY